MCGLVRPVFRLPYVPLSREQREQGKQILEGLREYLPGVKVCRRFRALGSCRAAWIVPGVGAGESSRGSGLVPQSQHRPNPLQDIRVMEDDEFKILARF
jgi:hypothetical protein